MKKGDQSKQMILKCSARLFMQQGYHNTAISDILTATNLPKGSFYYYFKSKKELGVAVAKFYGEEYTQWFQTILDGVSDHKQFIVNLCKDIHTKIQEGTYEGCPYTCFGTEATASDKEIALACEEGIAHIRAIWKEAFLLDGIEEEAAGRKAGIALSMYEGFLVYYRVTRNESIIDVMQDTLVSLEV